MNNNQSLAFAQREAEEIRKLLKKTVENIIDIGRRLIAVKARLKHGQWGEYLLREFDWSERTAQNFMNVAERFKNEKFADLNIAPSALYLLAAPSTPEIVRTAILDRARAGERVTYKIVKEALVDVNRQMANDPKFDSLPIEPAELLTLAILPKEQLDRLALERCDQIIEQHKDFNEFVEALIDIRDGRLYRGTHETFTEYCVEKWGMSRSMVNLLNELFPPSGLPRTEADERHVVSSLLSNAEWRTLPNEKIAEHCGVTVSLVEEMRAAMA